MFEPPNPNVFHANTHQYFSDASCAVFFLSKDTQTVRSHLSDGKICIFETNLVKNRNKYKEGTKQKSSWKKGVVLVIPRTPSGTHAP